MLRESKYRGYYALSRSRKVAKGGGEVISEPFDGLRAFGSEQWSEGCSRGFEN